MGIQLVAVVVCIDSEASQIEVNKVARSNDGYRQVRNQMGERLKVGKIEEYIIRVISVLSRGPR